MILSLGFLTSHAQQPAGQSAPAAVNQSNQLTPENMALRQSKRLGKMLSLNGDQEQKVYQAVLTRVTGVRSIKTKYGQNGDKKAMFQETKQVREQYVEQMNGILTPEQQSAWNAHRAEVKNHKNNRNMMNPAPPLNSGTPATELKKDDDGIEE